MHKLHLLPDDQTPCCSRRQALATFAVGAVGAVSACTSTVVQHVPGGTDAGSSGGGNVDGGAAADDAGSGGGTCTPVGKMEGPVANFPAGSWKKSGSVIIAQDAMGLYAYTAVCTHQGCIIDAPNSSGTATCPCHGAQFDGNGNVTRGPAGSPLKHFAVEVCDGVVYVDTGSTVSADTRTPAS